MFFRYRYPYTEGSKCLDRMPTPSSGMPFVKTSPAMDALPVFSLEDYGELLGSLKEHAYDSAFVSAMCDRTAGRVVYLRHDIDFFPEAAVAMAEKEAEFGFRASYYFLLSGPYNLLSAENRRVLARLVELGHEIGLHYDLGSYPEDPREAATALDSEAALLGRLCGREIRTIVMHNPSLGGNDWFRQSDHYVHPHDPRYQTGLLYVSDSCRAWRDENLLRCSSESPPQRLLLLTHPEIWLDGQIDDRQEYLEHVLKPLCREPLRQYFSNEVSSVWRDHAGAQSHDARQQCSLRADDLRFSWPDRSDVETQIEVIEARFREFVELPWTREQILLDLPEKWTHSLLMHQGNSIAGFAFNSVKGESLHIHALFVAPEFRHHGFGGRLIEKICERGRLFGFHCVRLRVAPSNQPALRFYEKHGFEVVNGSAQDENVEMECLADRRFVGLLRQ